MMNETDYNALLSSLNDAVAILARYRTPDPASVEAYDTLKIARARVIAAVEQTQAAAPEDAAELIAVAA